MDPDFWHERWQQGDVPFHRPDFNTHLQRFWAQLGLARGSRVFVPLCGKSRDMMWLATQGHSVLGVEISPVAVEGFFHDHGLVPRVGRAGDFEVWETDAIKLLCGDFFALGPTELRDVAGVYDRAALIALPPELRERYVRHLRAMLAADVSMLLVTLEYDPVQMQGPPFSVPEQEVHALYEDHYRIERVLAFDALPESPRFQQRGLRWLDEKVYLLKRQSS